jgi:tetratricopeptide (TPR) repeat protein
METSQKINRQHAPRSNGGRSDTRRYASVAALLLPVLSLGFISNPALSKGDPNFDDLLKKGREQLAIGETDKAIELFQKSVKKYPQSAACHTALGRALKRRGKLSEAKAEFKCACDVESNYADAFYELGAMLESDKEWDGAAQAFSHYLELSPDSAQRKTIEDRIKYCKGQKE